jgi:hypothetical protein
MAKNYFEKQPGESYTIGMDYSDTGVLPDGTALSSGTVSAVKLSDGITDNTVLGSTTTTIDAPNKLSKVLVQAGTNGEKYRITFLTTLDDASVLEDEVLMKVEDF